MISEEKKKIVIENYFKSECNINTTIHDAYVKGFERGLSKAPQPKRKIGRWIHHTNWERDGEAPYECDQCGRCFDYKMRFCGFCGAKMEVEHE